MRIVGNKLIARRNRNATLNFVLEYENGNPFVILSGWDHPYFVMTIASSRYTQEGRYMKSWWVPLEDQVKVEETTIEEVLGEDEFGRPIQSPADEMNKNRKRLVKTGPKSFWYSDMVSSSEGPVAEWISFTSTQINIPFMLQDTAEWIEQDYRWDCSIMVGTPTNAGQGKPALRDFIVVKSLVEDAEMEVLSDSMGGLR